MVTWRLLLHGLEVEVTFEEEDAATWQDFQTKGYGVAALEKLLEPLETSGNGTEMAVNTSETKRRRHLSLPEIYYLVVNGILPIDKPLSDLWELLKCSSPTFEHHFVVYQHFRRLGWTPKPGLNYGAHYVLYQGSAAEFHSEYVVYVQSEEVSSWNTIQSLTRIAADVKKTVLLCTVTAASTIRTTSDPVDLTFGVYVFHDVQYTVEAIAIRFWDAPVADDPQSCTFQPQPVLPKKIKKKRAKLPKHQLEGDDSTGSGNST
ncbi:hypothetical protein V7S43_015017 [Phytophthora oleae]|uniref:tRNA-intron lyase n=1 Tax=Phytophthora oleae TaxID=2107226 RepID=A0ABD3F287_9STRA